MENKKILIVLVPVLLAGGGVFWFATRPQKAPTEAPPARSEPEAKVPSEAPYEVFETADGNFSFEYPSAWTRTEIRNLETVLPKEFIDKYELTMPLILSDPRGAQASLSTYRFEKGMDLDAVMDALKAELVAMGQPYNEVSRKMVGEHLVVDSTVETQGAPVQIRDILFLVPSEPKNIIYNLSLVAPQEVWSDYEPLFNHIQNSAQLSL